MKEVLFFLFYIFLYCHGEPSLGCSESLPDQPHPGRHHKFSIIVEDPNLGEVTREYLLHLPAHYDTSNNVPVPMMMDFHGWTRSAHDQMANMHWRDVADMDQEGFIYVAMQGMNDVEGGGDYGSWNVSRYVCLAPSFPLIFEILGQTGH